MVDKGVGGRKVDKGREGGKEGKEGRKGGREEQMVTNEYRVSVWGDENILELNNGDGCATLNILNATERTF